MTYSYDPLKIKARGKDQMRFELGDTLVDGGADTCALADEEYEGMVTGVRAGRVAWLFAKLHTLEAIMFKLSYQVDTKIDVLSYAFGERAQLWRKLYEQIRDQALTVSGLPVMDARAQCKPAYFYTGMECNIRAGQVYKPYAPGAVWPFRNMTE